MANLPELSFQMITEDLETISKYDGINLHSIVSKSSEHLETNRDLSDGNYSLYRISSENELFQELRHANDSLLLLRKQLEEKTIDCSSSFLEEYVKLSEIENAVKQLSAKLQALHSEVAISVENMRTFLSDSTQTPHSLT